MDLKTLVTEFGDYELEPHLGKYRELVSTKTEDGRFFRPYIPLVGKHYKRHRVLIYGTAQNIPQKCTLVEEYSKNFDKLVERLYYSPDFKRKYPNDDLHFHEIAIGPYQDGVLSALAGVFIHAVFDQKVWNLDEIHNYVAISNYYKFSLHNKRDINPDKLESPEQYRTINNELVLRELRVLRPDHVITFKGRQVDVLKNSGFTVQVINDPAWILRGHKGCLNPQGRWGREVSQIEDHQLLRLVDSYLSNLRGLYFGKKQPVRIYLLKYHLEWSTRNLLKNT